MTIDELRAKMAKRPPISMEDLYAFRAWAEAHGILDGLDDDEEED